MAIKVSAYKRANVTLLLDGADRFTWENDKGHRFTVRKIIYSGGPEANVNGFAIRADGSDGVTERYATIDLKDLVRENLDTLVNIAMEAMSLT